MNKEEKEIESRDMDGARESVQPAEKLDALSDLACHFQAMRPHHDDERLKMLMGS